MLALISSAFPGTVALPIPVGAIVAIVLPGIKGVLWPIKIFRHPLSVTAVGTEVFIMISFLAGPLLEHFPAVGASNFYKRGIEFSLTLLATEVISCPPKFRSGDGDGIIARGARSSNLFISECSRAGTTTEVPPVSPCLGSLPRHGLAAIFTLGFDREMGASTGTVTKVLFVSLYFRRAAGKAFPAFGTSDYNWHFDTSVASIWDSISGAHHPERDARRQVASLPKPYAIIP